VNKAANRPYTVLRMLASYADYIGCSCASGGEDCRGSRQCARADFRKWVSRMRMHFVVTRGELKRLQRK